MRFAVGVALLLALAGCSNREGPINRQPHTGTTTAVSSGGVQEVVVRTDDTYRFYPARIIVRPGKVKITLVHEGRGAPHDLLVEAYPEARIGLVETGESASDTFEAPAPGEYRFVCTIHVAQGHTGTLVVLAS